MIRRSKGEEMVAMLVDEDGGEAADRARTGQLLR